MSANNKIFGWPAAIQDYSWSSILEDSFIPLIISVTLLFIILYEKIEIYLALSSIVSLSLQIIPIMLSLILAGYAIILTLYTSTAILDVKKSKVGNNLLIKINASFPMAIIIMILGIFASLVSSFILSLKIKSPAFISEDFINSVAFVLIMFLLVFSIRIIKDVTINIYNLGKSLLVL